MATVYEVPADKLLNEVSKDLKENVKTVKPAWAIFVKTGSHANRQPESPDWWWMREASILRKVYIDGPVGTMRLRTAYGGRKNRGFKPQRFQRSGGKVIRVALQQLDGAGFTEKFKGGRRITAKGRAYLDKLATNIAVPAEKK
jgi:small subunit ribosomal protein S19e